MLYNTTNVKTAQDMPTFIPAGIHENIKLTDIKYSTTVNNNEFLAFYFENAHGDTFSHTEWPVRLNKPLTAMSEDEVSRYHSIIEIQLKKIKQIIETFLTRGTYKEIEAESFKDFSNQVINLLQNKIGTLVRLKIIYNDRNFTSFPRDPNHTFIESMNVSKEDTKIRILPNDKLVKSIPDIEIQRSNPFVSEENSIAETSSAKSQIENNSLF